MFEALRGYGMTRIAIMEIVMFEMVARVRSNPRALTRAEKPADLTRDEEPQPVADPGETMGSPMHWT